MSTLVCGFFCIIIPCANIYFSHSQTFRQLGIQKFTPEDEDQKRYLTFKFMVEALQFSDGGGFNIGTWITAFYRGLTRICTPEQDGDANPEIVCSWWVNKRGDSISENRQIRYFIKKMLFQ